MLDHTSEDYDEIKPASPPLPDHIPALNLQIEAYATVDAVQVQNVNKELKEHKTGSSMIQHLESDGKLIN